MSVRALLHALLARDEAGAREVVEAVLAASGQRVAVFADLVQPAMTGLSDLWYRGRITVEDEAWAVAALAELARSLAPTLTRSPVPPGSRIVLAGLGDEEHGIGMELLSMALADDGWDVDCLGPRTPPGVLLERVAERWARVAGLSASYLPAPGTLVETIRALKARRIRVLVGGQAFNRAPGLWQRVGADRFGMDARAAVVMARRLLPESRAARSARRVVEVPPGRWDRRT